MPGVLFFLYKEQDLSLHKYLYYVGLYAIETEMKNILSISRPNAIELHQVMSIYKTSMIL